MSYQECLVLVPHKDSQSAIHSVEEQAGADFVVYVTVRQNIAAKFEVVEGIKRYTETGGKRDKMVNVSTQFLKIYLQEL